MFKYLSISSNLFLLEQEVSKPVQSKPIQIVGTNNIWWIDASGSMSYVIRDLANDLIDMSKLLKVGDTLTIGWFSGEGQRGLVVKGFRIVTNSDYGALEKMIRANAYTRGTTCFSEALADTDQIITDLAAISPQFSFTLLTDGCPVVSDIRREMANIKSAIAKLAGRVTSALLVGYGNYYNKDLMGEMAQGLSGTLIHSSSLAEFRTGLTMFVEDVRDLAGQKVEVQYDREALVSGTAPFSIAGRSLFQYSTDDNKLSVVLTKKVKDYVYTLVTRVPKDAEEVQIKVTDSKRFDKQPLGVAAYGAALMCTQRTKSDLALQILGSLGDVALIKAVANSFTNEEYGKAEKQILDAVNSPSGRFTQGQDTKFLPKDDAFCLLDAVGLLTSDDQAKFHPYHPSFQYSRVGVKSNQKPDTPVFAPDKTAACELSSLVWHETRLNLSIKVQIFGLVKLMPVDGREPAAFGLAADHPANIFRTYTLVKDGLPNVQVLPVSMSESTFTKFKDEGLIDDASYSAGTVYAVHLNRVPVVNRALAKGKTSAKELCAKVIEEHQLKAAIKAHKWILETKFPEKQDTKKTYGDLQQSFLEANYINPVTWTFNPPTEAEDAKDFYEAKRFEIKLKGLSSLPKVEDVKKKAEAGAKKLTVAEAMVNEGLKKASSIVLPDSKTEKTWLEGLLQSEKNELAKVRGDAQRTKFAILLGKSWFQEFTSRDENVLDVNGISCTVKVSEERVPY